VASRRVPFAVSDDLGEHARGKATWTVRGRATHPAPSVLPPKRRSAWLLELESGRTPVLLELTGSCVAGFTRCQSGSPKRPFRTPKDPKDRRFACVLSAHFAAVSPKRGGSACLPSSFAAEAESGRALRTEVHAAFARPLGTLPAWATTAEAVESMTSEAIRGLPPRSVSAEAGRCLEDTQRDHDDTFHGVRFPSVT
jgi:hypothetical protein